MGNSLNRFVFQPPKASYANDTNLIWLTTRYGEMIPSFFIFRSTDAPTLLFSHGNAEDLGTVVNYFREVAPVWDVNIFAYEYTGYGVSSGSPSEKNVYADIEAAYDYLVKICRISTDKIVLYGRSLGTAASVHLAASRRVKAMILQSALLSIHRVGLSLRFTLPGDMFCNVDKIANVECPVFFIHGVKDEIIPFSHGLELYNACPNATTPYWIEGAGHNNVEMTGQTEFFENVARFLKYIYRYPSTVKGRQTESAAETRHRHSRKRSPLRLCPMNERFCGPKGSLLIMTSKTLFEKYGEGDANIRQQTMNQAPPTSAITGGGGVDHYHFGVSPRQPQQRRGARPRPLGNKDEGGTFAPLWPSFLWGSWGGTPEGGDQSQQLKDGLGGRHGGGGNSNVKDGFTPASKRSIFPSYQSRALVEEGLFPHNMSRATFGGGRRKGGVFPQAALNGGMRGRQALRPHRANRFDGPIDDDATLDDNFQFDDDANFRSKGLLSSDDEDFDAGDSFSPRTASLVARHSDKTGAGGGRAAAMRRGGNRTGRQLASARGLASTLQGYRGTVNPSLIDSATAAGGAVLPAPLRGEARAQFQSARNGHHNNGEDWRGGVRMPGATATNRGRKIDLVNATNGPYSKGNEATGAYSGGTRGARRQFVVAGTAKVAGFLQRNNRAPASCRSAGMPPTVRRATTKGGNRLTTSKMKATSRGLIKGGGTNSIRGISLRPVLHSLDGQPQHPIRLRDGNRSSRLITNNSRMRSRQQSRGRIGLLNFVKADTKTNSVERYRESSTGMRNKPPRHHRQRIRGGSHSYRQREQRDLRTQNRMSVAK